MAVTLKRAGWSLGAACPYGCKHCYTRETRALSRELSRDELESVVDSLAAHGVQSVVLGGNEPIYAGGPNPHESLLPHIVTTLRDRGIAPIIVSSGLSVALLMQRWPGVLEQFAAAAISLDFAEARDHDLNRGAPLFKLAMRAIEQCHEASVPTVILTTALRSNFDKRNLEGLLALAQSSDSLLRINTYKTRGALSDPLAVPVGAYWEGFRLLIENSVSYLVDEPPIRPWFGLSATPPNCGERSIRIGFPGKDGRLAVTPCQYRPDDALAGHLRYPASPCYSTPACFDYGVYGAPPFPPARASLGTHPVAQLFSDYLCTWIGAPA